MVQSKNENMYIAMEKMKFEEKINDLKLLLAEISGKVEGLDLKFEEYKKLGIKSVSLLILYQL